MAHPCDFLYSKRLQALRQIALLCSIEQPLYQLTIHTSSCGVAIPSTCVLLHQSPLQPTRIVGYSPIGFAAPRAKASPRNDTSQKAKIAFLHLLQTLDNPVIQPVLCLLASLTSYGGDRIMLFLSSPSRSHVERL